MFKKYPLYTVSIVVLAILQHFVFSKLTILNASPDLLCLIIALTSMSLGQRTGTTFKVDTRGLPIGIEKGTHYEQKRFSVEKGDCVLLFTDGILEAMNPAGQQYGLAGLRRVVERCAVLPATELVSAIREDLGRFVGNARQHDDQTLLVMKAN